MDPSWEYQAKIPCPQPVPDMPRRAQTCLGGPTHVPRSVLRKGWAGGEGEWEKKVVIPFLPCTVWLCSQQDAGKIILFQLYWVIFTLRRTKFGFAVAWWLWTPRTLFSCCVQQPGVWVLLGSLCSVWTLQSCGWHIPAPELFPAPCIFFT